MSSDDIDDTVDQFIKLLNAEPGPAPVDPLEWLLNTPEYHDYQCGVIECRKPVVSLHLLYGATPDYQGPVEIPLCRWHATGLGVTR